MNVSLYGQIPYQVKLSKESLPRLIPLLNARAGCHVWTTWTGSDAAHGKPRKVYTLP
jgi:hypothetical protein